MKKLLVLFLVNGTICTMETHRTEDKQQQSFLHEIYGNEIEPMYDEQKSSEEIDKENKKIINLLDGFAQTLNAKDTDTRDNWCQAMSFLTGNLMLSVQFPQYKDLAELQKIFGTMKGQRRKMQWQAIISRSFEHMHKASIRKENFFSDYMQQYIKADLIVRSLFDGIGKVEKKKYTYQNNELIDELRRLYENDEELKVLLMPPHTENTSQKQEN